MRGIRGALETWLVVAAWVALVALVLGARELVRRPRLAVELSLRGAILYVRVHNRGRRAARVVRVGVAWSGPGGRSASEAAEVDELEGRGAAALTVRDLQRGASGPWTAVEVTARAANARASSARLALAPDARAPPVPPAPSVVYRDARSMSCPGSIDGRHLDRATRILNDGAYETWHVCERCRLVWREPLTPAEEATQTAVRRERARREREKLERELEREERRSEPPPEREADDTMPAAVAFWILGLDETSATWADVVAAHRRLALENHPDRAGDEAARAVREQRMMDINRARDRLRRRFGEGSP